MSDTGRQSFTDKVENTLKPESQKSTTESWGDSIKSTADSAASTLQPESEKSTTQKIGDSASSNSNENNDSLLGKAQDALGLGERR
ncbi:heat shock protein 9/12-domain-containing protein [Lentinula raphanica]|uniref:Heat shock protein 9/12-domain-containing protein n=1 Tax=Lentinula raphanica TaxID=153919 RepID=A0AA38UDN1_9AGAR|nr:heat shock protein 9/12-domain-containing protein [Lentinula raphanica]KAJ3775392.1 heat shock protein 9/12-domain-containing protein [Lentinula raphanica]KAJ3834317.1 heat shock protein 9/12-domain-containing protein [Lentinula raphanica]KAJ3974655.1 heat shock protein 9/12-domain-containing protein [Lentinula raphanica]